MVIFGIIAVPFSNLFIKWKIDWIVRNDASYFDKEKNDVEEFFLNNRVVIKDENKDENKKKIKRK